MTTRLAPTRRRPWWAAALMLVPVLLLALQGLTFQAQAAELDWVDGGDDQLCLQDDVGAALSHPEIEQCSPIIGCETGEVNGRAWIRFPTKNGVWQPKAAYQDYLVLYGNDPLPSATPTATPSSSPTPSATPSSTPSSAPTAKPTAKPSSSSTPKPSAGSTTKPSGSATPSATATPAATTDDEKDLGLDVDEEVAEGAPTAPAAPKVTVDGSDVTVTWEASADAELEGVTGYVLRFSGADPVETDATTTSHTFTGLADGNYRSAVRAVNAAGESPSSPPSDIATVGAPIADIKGTLTVTGALEPGATVDVSGTGYAPNVPELVLELHSTPIQVGTVATGADGAFATTVTLPADIEPGDHHLVVLYDGTEVTSTPVALVAAAAPDSTDGTETADTAAAPTETVPPRTGLAILGALALLGFVSLLWHPLRSRRRRAQHAHAPSGPRLPSAVSGVSTEVI